MPGDDLVTIWALPGAGSTVNVVDYEKQFPCQKVKEPTEQRKGVNTSQLMEGHL